LLSSLALLHVRGNPIDSLPAELEPLLASGKEANVFGGRKINYM